MVIKIYTLLFVFSLFVLGCKEVNKKTTAAKKYSHWVGDIHFDSQVDDPDFLLCDSSNVIHRRNGLKYPGGKEAIKNECLKKYNFKPTFNSFSGYMMVRFIINCKNEKGRLRVQPLDFDFSIKESSPELKEHLLAIIKELNGWEAASVNDEGSDFSKYLNFKIENGQIENILQ